MMTTKRACSVPMSVLLAALVAPLALSAAPARAQNIIDEWASVKAPAAPALKPVTVNPKTTALLMLDFMNQNCGKRPRCLASIPVMKKLLGEARAAKAAVVYSLIHNSTTDDVIKDRGIEIVIVTGTAANSAVLFTASEAALRGMNVIVPVDGMSAFDPYAELTTAYTLASAPLISLKTTLTTIDMIKF